MVDGFKVLETYIMHFTYYLNHGVSVKYTTKRCKVKLFFMGNKARKITRPCRSVYPKTFGFQTILELTSVRKIHIFLVIKKISYTYVNSKVQ